MMRWVSLCPAWSSTAPCGTRFRLLAAPLAAATMALVAAPAAASVTFSPVLIRAEALLIDDPVAEDRRPALQLGPLASERSEALLQPDVWLRAAMSGSGLDGGFVSAAISAQAIGAVGVSGLRRGGPNGLASWFFGQEITNTGSTPEYLDIRMHVPGMELLVSDFNSFDAAYARGGPFAGIAASMAYLIRDAEGNDVQGDFLFDIGARMRQVSRNLDDPPLLETSESLRRLEENTCAEGECLRSFVRETRNAQAIAGYRWGATDWAYLGMELLPGRTVALSYSMSAFVAGGDPVIVDDNGIGLQALIGDPFDIGHSGASLSIRQALATPVPEPGSVMLLAGGLVVLARTTRRLAARRGYGRFERPRRRRVTGAWRPGAARAGAFRPRPDPGARPWPDGTRRRDARSPRRCCAWSAPWPWPPSPGC